MLQPLLHSLQTKRIILASSSPRRKEILKLINLPFEIIVSNFEENLEKDKFDHPYEYAMENAKQKALAVSKVLEANQNPADLIIGADTVVYMNKTIYEKPANRSDAIDMLSLFNGQAHTVYTGVALVSRTDSADCSVDTFYEETKVKMGKLSREIIEAYVDTGEPMDKAGGYGIQKIGASLIEEIEGDFYNVEGFPLYRFCTHVSNMFK